MKVKCSCCGKEKLKMKAATSTGRSWTYVDEAGKTWRGAKCRDCVTELGKRTTFVATTTNNKCRQCGCKLPSNRRFNCEDCLEKLQFNDDFLYC